MKQKLVMLTMIFTLMYPGNIIAQMTETSETIEYRQEEVQQCIDNFFYAYEGIGNFDDTSDSMKVIQNLSSDINLNSKPDEESYLNTVQYMLERKDYIQKVTDVDLTEYNKKVNTHITNINKRNNMIDVTVDVYRTWNYSFSNDIESATKDTYVVSLGIQNHEYVINDITGFGASIFDVELTRKSDKISKNEKNEMLNELKTDFVAELKSHTDELKSQEKSAVAEKTATNNYNGDSASSYALNHALDYNTDYADFNGLGGDCTNFISQCLKSGGIKQHTGTAYAGNCWLYKSSTNRSSTWTGANEFRQYVTGSSSKINMPSSSWGSVSFGDIIQLMSGGQAYHSMIISGIVSGSSGRSDLLICCHSTDRRHVSLNTYLGSSTKTYYHVKGNK